MEARAAQWHALADASGLPHLPLDLAPAWLQQRQGVLDLVSELGDTERQQAAQRHAGVESQQSLWSLLGAESSETSAPVLAECVRRARAQITLADQAHGQRATLEQQLHEAQNS